MDVSTRHAGRMLAAYRENGAAAIAHGHRGRKAPNATPKAVAYDVVHLVRTRYSGANHTHLSELLNEREGIDIGRTFLRQARFIWQGRQPQSTTWRGPQGWSGPRSRSCLCRRRTPRRSNRRARASLKLGVALQSSAASWHLSSPATGRGSIPRGPGLHGLVSWTYQALCEPVFPSSRSGSSMLWALSHSDTQYA